MEQRRFPWLVALIGVGCLGILCIGTLVLGGGALLLTSDSETAGEPPAFTQELALVATQTESPAAAPTPAPTAGPEQTGGQQQDDHSFFDDFSSDSLGWPRYDDGKTILAYEEGEYSLQIAEPDYWDWVYFPDYFYPVEFRFDVRGPAGSQDGTFGILCHYQDVDNYYYIEFDLDDASFIIAEYFQGEEVLLSEPGTNDPVWQSTGAFGPHSTPNRIGVSCTLDMIRLTINDEFVDLVQVQQPFEQQGEVAFFVYSFPDAGPEGYKVWLDNVEAWDSTQ
jgi:hypothetical protein